MDYIFVPGSHEGNQLLYIMSEKRLYVKKCRRKSGTVFICYQTVLAKRKLLLFFSKLSNICFLLVNYRYKVVKHVDPVMCNARVTLHENGILTKNQKPHSSHENHECYFTDLRTRKNIMDKCKMAKEMFPDSANRISSQFIFNREMARYYPQTFFFINF